MARTSILDDKEALERIDKSHMLSFCAEAPKHYGNAIELAKDFEEILPEPRNIIVAGMGGSAIGGELLKVWGEEKISIPIDVCRDYHLPSYADSKTLVFCTSYSGETEETLSVFLEALRRKCGVITIGSGGTLQAFAQKLCIPHLLVPSGMAPRATLPYLFIPLLVILEKAGLTGDLNNELIETVTTLKQISSENSSDKLINSNLSKRLALNINGTMPIVYGFGLYQAVAHRLKTQFNENSKNPAKWDYFPELNHNEIVGWEAVGKLGKHLSTIFLRDKQETIEIRERIEFTKETVSKQGIRTNEIWSKGFGAISKMASIICIGDFASVYLAVLRGVDPTPVKTISCLKERLSKTGVKEKTIAELNKIVRR